ncbi:MAG: flagellar hook-length control protein FliK [Planctomycetota bacterium]|nr:flagellar hook-length control protein FliK [Planctomycetota bacterium]
MRTKQARAESADRRSERRDDVESRSDDKVKGRERPERSDERPERFSLHLQEQNASFASHNELKTKGKTESSTQSEPSDEAPETEAKEPSKTTKGATTSSTDADGEGEFSPAIEGVAIEVQAAVDAESLPAESSTDAPITPPAILPTIAPVLANTAPSATGLSASELEPAPAAAPEVDGEQKPIGGELATTKLGATHGETHNQPVPAANAKNDAALEAAKIESPRETPAARTAEEVERAADILRQIRVQITPQLSEARIQLHPIELGRISIHLSVEDGRVKTTVHAEKQETLQAIQTHLPELRASLRQHGIDAQEFQLSLGFEDRGSRDTDKSSSRSNPQKHVAEASAIERSPALHAALAKSGVDFYA